MKRVKKAIYLFSLMILLGVFSSCEKQDPDKAMPVLFQVDSLWLYPSSGQGTASHNISDIWIYVDDQFIGAYELPLIEIPVLEEGQSQLLFYPGIKMNGISNTRIPYPFYQPIEKQVDLTRGEVFELKDKEVNYHENTKFAWMEDFEGGVPTFDTTSRSDVMINRLGDKSKIFSYPGEQNIYSGIIELNSDSSFFEIITKDELVLPGEGTYVFMELNFKTDIEFTAGIFANSATVKDQQAILVMRPTETWKKIYINLTPTVSSAQDAGDFNIYFSGNLPEDMESAEIMIDNVKVVHL